MAIVIVKSPMVWAFRCLFTLTIMCVLTGCVERQLSINTTPPGALVVLNDEEIGESPVSVSFQWYGDYRVHISKPGYQTLQTHQALARPWYDYFPFDFVAQILNPQHIVDRYEWTFELSEAQTLDRNTLMKNANSLQADAVEPTKPPAELP